MPGACDARRASEQATTRGACASQAPSRPGAPRCEASCRVASVAAVLTAHARADAPARVPGPHRRSQEVRGRSGGRVRQRPLVRAQRVVAEPRLTWCCCACRQGHERVGQRHECGGQGMRARRAVLWSQGRRARFAPRAVTESTHALRTTQVRLLADPRCEFCKQLGCVQDNTDTLGSVRSRRFSMARPHRSERRSRAMWTDDVVCVRRSWTTTSSSTSTSRSQAPRCAQEARGGRRGSTCLGGALCFEPRALHVAYADKACTCAYRLHALTGPLAGAERLTGGQRADAAAAAEGRRQRLNGARRPDSLRPSCCW